MAPLIFGYPKESRRQCKGGEGAQVDRSIDQ